MTIYRRASLLLGLLLWTACAPLSRPSPTTEQLRVVATTSLVGEVVHAVAGDHVQLTVLTPRGVDPHGFEPSPGDLSRLAEADVVFINGLGLEGPLTRVIASAVEQAPVVVVSEGAALLPFGGNRAAVDQQGAADGASSLWDPHVWFNPLNVIVWTQNIADTLAELDPAHVDTYQENAQAYQEQLEQLDQWAQAQFDQLSPERRRLVTDHDAFGYLAERYHLEVVGTVLPGASTLAEPSARELAALEDAIRDLGVRAIFVGNTVNPSLMERVARDTGVELVPVYTGSLSAETGPAHSYLALFRYDVEAIVGALTQEGTP